MKLSECQRKLFEEFSQIIRENRLSHAYLFSGDFGSLDMAIWLAQSRFCLTPEDGLPCSHCRPCRLIAQGDFLKLLHAETKEREKIFRTIFNTQIFFDLQEKISATYLDRKRRYESLRQGAEEQLGEIRLSEEETYEKKQPEAEECWERLKRNVKERRLEVLDEIIRDLKVTT